MKTKVLDILISNGFTYSSKLNRYVRIIESKTHITNIVVGDDSIICESRLIGTDELTVNDTVSYKNDNDFVNKYIDIMNKLTK